MSLVNTFSQGMACLLILLTLFFTEKKFLILMKSSLSIISFMDCCGFDVVSKMASPYPRLSRLFPTLSSRSFIVLYAIFRSVIHFELIFVKWLKVCVKINFFACGYSAVPAPFVEETIFVPLLPLLLCQSFSWQQ